MSRTRKNLKRCKDEFIRFVPPEEPLFRKDMPILYENADLVLGVETTIEEDVCPRVGLIIAANCQCDVYGKDVVPRHHRVMWSDGSIEINSEDDLASVSHY